MSAIKTTLGLTAITILVMLGLGFGFIGLCYAIFSTGNFLLSTLATITSFWACVGSFKAAGTVMDILVGN